MAGQGVETQSEFSVPIGARARRGPSVVAVAVAGILLGHLVTYVLLVPRPDERAALLHDAGHGYFPVALEAALVVAMLSLASWFLRAVARRDRDVDSSLFGRLARLQLAGFAAMEVTERVASGTPLLELVHDRIFVGLAVQLIVAWLAARVLTALGHVAERIRGFGGREVPRASLGMLVPSGYVDGRLVVAAPSPRAPPRPAVSVR